jgi:hypothetical protein
VGVLSEGDWNLTTPITAFAVAPSETQIAELGLGPSLQDLRAAVREPVQNVSSLLSAVRSKLGGGKPEGMVSHTAVRRTIDSVRFQRLQNVLGGLVARSNGTLEFRTPHHRSKGVASDDLARLYVARLLGDGSSPYSCIEDNLYVYASKAPAISREEKTSGQFPGRSALYGEIGPEGVATIVQTFGGINRSDSFFDLGSGLGKVALQVFLSTDAGHVVGVELAESRHNGAVEALEALRIRYPSLASELTGGRTLQFLHEDILKADLSNATVIWMGSLAFPKELLAKVGMRILDQVRDGCKVLTMLEFPVIQPDQRKMQLVKKGSFLVDVRWTSKHGSKAYLYEVAY